MSPRLTGISVWVYGRKSLLTLIDYLNSGYHSSIRLAIVEKVICIPSIILHKNGRRTSEIRTFNWNNWWIDNLWCLNCEISKYYTTSMEKERTRVLKEIKLYLRGKDQKYKKLCIDIWRDIEIYVKEYTLFFKTRFPTSGLIYRRKMANLWHQALQGQTIAKPTTSP